MRDRISVFSFLALCLVSALRLTVPSKEEFDNVLDVKTALSTFSALRRKIETL